jgi:hypothetical protein
MTTKGNGKGFTNITKYCDNVVVQSNFMKFAEIVASDNAHNILKFERNRAAGVETA